MAAQPVGGLTAAQPAFGDYDDYTGRMGPDGEPERYSTMRGGDPRVRQQQELAEYERRLQDPITLSSWMTGAKKDVRGLDPASQITLNPGTQYQIRDYTGKNEGQVIASGSTPEELLRLQDVARGLANQGRMADYRIEQVGGTPTGGLGQYRDPTTGEAVTLLGGDLYNSPGTKVVGDILKIAAPIALQFVPGFGTVLGTKLGLSGLAAKAAGVGLTSALGRAGAGLVTGENIGEALKAGAIGGLGSAATAGLLGATGVDKALGSALGSGKGALVGEAAREAAASVPGEIVVSASRFAPAVLGGLGGVGGSLLGDVGKSLDPFQQALDQARLDNEFGLGDTVVSGSRIPQGGLDNILAGAVPSSLNVGTPTDTSLPGEELLAEASRTQPNRVSNALAAGFDQVLSDNAGMVGDDPELLAEADRIKRFEAEAAAAAAAGGALPAAVAGDDPLIDVTAKKNDDINIGGGGLSGAASNLALPGAQLIADAAAGQTGDKKKDTLDKIADAATIAGLVIPAIGALAGGGGKGGTGTYTSGAGALNPIFSGKLPTPGEGGAFRVGGLDYTTPPARSAVDMYRYAMGPAMDIPAGMDLSGATSPYAGFGPGTLGRETFNRVTGLEVPPRPTGFEVAPSPTGDLTNRKVGETKVVDGDTYVWGGNQNGWQRQYKDPTTGETKLFSGNGATSVTSLADMLASGMATQRPANQPFFKQNLTNIPDWANTYRNWQTAMRGAGVPEAERSAAEREFMTALEQRPFANAKELFDFARGLLDRSRRPKAAARGGPMGYSRGSSRESFAVEGPGTGRSDDIPAVLSDGEYVIDAETVALLGDGSSRAGAKKLDELRVKVRKHKGKNLAAGKFSVNAKNPEAYMRGGRI
jgi:hypothetical protein